MKQNEESPGNLIWEKMKEGEAQKNIVADRLGITPTMLNKYLYNQTMIPIETAYKMEKVLKINARNLLICQIDYYLNAIKRREEC